MFFQLDILEFCEPWVKCRVYLPTGVTTICYITTVEFNRLQAFGTFTIFDKPDAAGVLGTTKCYSLK